MRFLVVEDEPLVREHISLEIKRISSEFSVTECKSAKEVEAVLASMTPDFAVLDINLNSAKSGIDIAKRLRAEHPTKIIFLTAYSDRQTMALALAAQPDAFLTKPFNMTQLQATIQTVLHQTRAHVDLLFRNELPQILDCFRVLSRLIDELQATEFASLKNEVLKNFAGMQERIRELSSKPSVELVDSLISSARVTSILIETWPQTGHDELVSRYKSTVELLVQKLKTYAARGLAQHQVA